MQPKLVESADALERVVYLDNNATTRPHPEVVEAMVRILGPDFGNASSAHSGGEEARRSLARARASTANLIGADPDNVVFTSSGTEANNMALRSGVNGSPRRGLITSSIEHSSIVKTAEMLVRDGIRVLKIAPSRSGIIEPSAVEEAIAAESPGLVSIQWVNSETGVINPIADIGKLCRAAGVLFHTDAAQAVGKLKVDATGLPIDFLTFTAHKFHGPAGIGVLYAKEPNRLVPVIHGGDQEGGLRAGTENLAGIVGAGVAAALRHKRLEKIQISLTDIRDLFESALLGEFPWIEVNGGGEQRVCNTSNLHFRGLDGQALVAQLDAIGIQCSQSSACTNLRPEPSYVLRAMGLTEGEAYASVRFSFGEQNTADEIRNAVEKIYPIINKLRAILA